MQKHKETTQQTPIKYQWHLIVCVLVLLVVSYLSFQQLDLYVVSHVEFKSLFNAGAMATESYSVFDVYDAVVTYSAQHTPGFFMLLHTWGNLFSWDVAIARIPAIFAGLLSLAMMYRLARDFVAPIGGVFAIVLLASSAFYAFYIPQIRMYPFLLLFNMVTLWLYLRILYQQRNVKPYDYAALFLMSALSLWIHIFSVVFLGMLGVYHLLFVSKTKRWWWVSVWVTVAVVLISPYYLVIISGIDRVVEMNEVRQIYLVETIQLWLTFFLNGSPVFALICVVGILIGIMQKTIRLRLYMLLGVIYLLIVGLMAQFTPIIAPSVMRYFISGWIPMIMLIVVGLVALIRLNQVFGLVIIIPIIAGWGFNMNTDWELYLDGRYGPYLRSPIHTIARDVLEQSHVPSVIGYNSFEIYLTYEDNISYSQGQYFFDDQGIPFTVVSDEATFTDTVNLQTINEPTIWVFYKQSRISDKRLAVLDNVMTVSYELCETQSVGVDSAIRKYYWSVLDCQLPRSSQQFESSIVEYDWGQAIVDEDNQRLSIVDQWRSVNNANTDGYNISYQLLTGDWEKVAQLDLPLVNEGQFRLFNIDISDAPSGNYRLVGILYNGLDGSREEWVVEGQNIGDLITLTEVTVE